MRQPLIWIIVLIVIGLIVALTVVVLRIPQASPKVFSADNGPNFIDVSRYPPKMQEYYQLFTNKCSRCHTVARPINTKLATEEWKQYVYKMMRKPGSGLTPATADKIIEFLIYDAKKREK